MKTHDTELQLIKDLLRVHPKGMKITRIARDLAMNRNAAAKYLEILLMTGQVEMLEHGMSKIFILSRRTCIPTMLDRSKDFILILDRDMKISQVNENYLEFTGMRREALIGKRPDVICIPVIGKRPLFDRIRESHYGADIRTEVREVLHDREFFFDVRLTPTVFNDGKRGTTIIIGDITQEKQALESVTDENRTLIEGILSCICEAVILMDVRSGTISYVNPAALKMFNFSRMELVGKNPGLLIGIGGTIPGYPGNLKDIFRKQGYYETESRLRRNGSGEFTVNLHLRPICNTYGNANNIVMVIRDMTSCTMTGQGVSSPATQNLDIPFSLPVFSADPKRYRPVG